LSEITQPFPISMLKSFKKQDTTLSSELVHRISIRAFYVAKHTRKARYEFLVTDDIEVYMDDILSRLRKKFPETWIEYTTLARGPDGNLYPVKESDLNTKKYIVLDWSQRHDN